MNSKVAISIRVFSVLVFFLPMLDKANASTLPYTKIHCGDHWFNFDISLDPHSTGASVYFGGDSAPSISLRRGSYSFESEHSVNVTFADATGGSISIDGSDAYHVLYWGSGRLSLDGTAESFGLCGVE